MVLEIVVGVVKVVVVVVQPVIIIVVVVIEICFCPFFTPAV